MNMAMHLQTWWKKSIRQAIPAADPWNTSSMESWVTREIDMEIKWTAGTRQPSWPTTGAAVLVCLKIHVHIMTTILMMGLNPRM
jgi:hypothetical protein